MRRCINSADKDYKRYGAVGVVVCQDWHDYLRFAADMGEPIGTQTLDRIDTYGNYTKENCRWASLATQARNIRAKKTNPSGVTGVICTNGKWMASITANKKRFYSKCFATVAEAAVARKELERLHWGVC